ncbi:hypothetical protein ECANGB1_937 [Enterospora canceri]|uniref:BZIP domain-containing protein n=1 Tax=Enterospora canceri TaxID=1081671 RepID=A0A1Y1S7A3_9MICR|nr:hypothetical protein ECANGB1_937 [Enterospora canceri]
MAEDDGKCTRRRGTGFSEDETDHYSMDGEQYTQVDELQTIYYLNSMNELAESFYNRVAEMDEMNEMIEKESAVVEYRREKNRAAAKKSRVKKALYVKKLEKSEQLLRINIVEYEECVFQYDSLLKMVMEYALDMIHANEDERNQANWRLLDQLEEYRNRTGIYLENVLHLANTRRLVENESIDRLCELLKEAVSKITLPNYPPDET